MLISFPVTKHNSVGPQDSFSGTMSWLYTTSWGYLLSPSEVSDLKRGDESRK